MLKGLGKITHVVLVICIIASMMAFNTLGVSAEAKNPRGGICPGGNFLNMTDAQLTTFLNDFDTTKALYIRIDLAWSVVQPTNSTTWDFSRYDRLINAILAKGLKVLAMPTYCPSWANGGYSNDKYPPTAAHADSWYNFVKACGDRYIPLGVDVWEMWNEPNINAFWMPQANVANYTNIVLKPGSNAIRASAAALEKTVTVITGGLSPAATNGTNISPADFVTGIYTNGGKSYFDALGHHPYSFPEGPNSTSSYSAFQQTIGLNQIMVNNGDGNKKIWATEVGFHTGNTSIGGVSENLQAQYVADAYNRWNGWSFTGPMIWYTYQDSGTNMNDREQNFGLKRYNGTFKPAWQTYKDIMAGTMPPPEGECDLIVTDISWTPASPVSGSTVTFSATIRNQGTGASPAGIIHGVAFQLDGGGTTIWSDNYTSSIAPGASVTVTANGGVAGAAWTAAAGTHTVTAIVDDVHRIAEGNESNNSYTENIVITSGQCDLIVTDISWTPANPARGSTVTFRATIKNQGTGASPAGIIHGVAFQLDGAGTTIWSDNYTSSIAPGASVTVTANGGVAGSTWTAAAGTHTVTAIVDDVHRITESNESNNTYSENIVIP